MMKSSLPGELWRLNDYFFRAKKVALQKTKLLTFFEEWVLLNTILSEFSALLWENTANIWLKSLSWRHLEPAPPFWFPPPAGPSPLFDRWHWEGSWPKPLRQPVVEAGWKVGLHSSWFLSTLRFLVLVESLTISDLLHLISAQLRCGNRWQLTPFHQCGIYSWVVSINTKSCSLHFSFFKNKNVD